MIACVFISCNSYKNLTSAELYMELPDYCPTPDAFAISSEGLILSCPNYAEKLAKGVLVLLSKDGKIKELCKVPGIKTGTFASPMGINYAPDGTLIVCANQGENRGQILRMSFKGDKLVKTEVIATGINNPNGVKVHNGNIYVTTPRLPKFKTTKMTSGIYRFSLNDRNVKVENDSTDTHLIFTVQTNNPIRQFGLDGLDFDKDGNLFVGDFGDGVIYKLKLSANNEVESQEVYATLSDTTGVDGIVIDKKGNLYVAGFSQNQIWKINKKREAILIAEYPDNDGSKGELDQPADLIIYDKKLIISNFDLMTDADMVNRKHSSPFTLSFIKLRRVKKNK